MIINAVNWGNALIISLIGFMMVLLLLVLLVVIVSCFGLFAKKSKDTPIEQKKQNSKLNDKGLTPAESAAIAMAVHLYFDLHDEESDVITFRDVNSKYSPWNSKDYGVNN